MPVKTNKLLKAKKKMLKDIADTKMLEKAKEETKTEKLKPIMKGLMTEKEPLISEGSFEREAPVRTYTTERITPEPMMKEYATPVRPEKQYAKEAPKKEKKEVRMNPAKIEVSKKRAIKINK